MQCEPVHIRMHFALLIVGKKSTLSIVRCALLIVHSLTTTFWQMKRKMISK